MEEVKEVKIGQILRIAKDRIEAEARDMVTNCEMAEKVFQLLERLKLAELSKTRPWRSLISGKPKQAHRRKCKATESNKRRTRKSES